MDEELRILRTARDKALPRKLHEDSGFDIDRIIELFDAGLLAGTDATTYDSREYLDLRITHLGRQRLQHLEEAESSAHVKTTSLRPSNNGPRVFISHSSSDRASATALAGLLKASLNLASAQIRCTSVDGYKLPPGASSDEQLRHEVLDSDVFVALLSPASLASVYVMFEMGARWSSPKKLLPVLIGGLTTPALKRPLDGINAVSASNESDIDDLLVDIADQLKIQLEKKSLYDDSLKRFSAAASTLSEQSTRTEAQSERSLTKDEVAALWFMAHQFDSGFARVGPADVSIGCRLGRLAAQVALDGLDSEGLASLVHTPNGPLYALSSPLGRQAAAQYLRFDDPAAAWSDYERRRIVRELAF